MNNNKTAVIFYQITITGLVQGVGFRPFIKNLSNSLSVSGTVKNINGAVFVNLQCSDSKLDEWLELLARTKPSSADIEQIDIQHLEIDSADRRTGFEILPSDDLGGENARLTFQIPKDIAPCDQCIQDLSDPKNRRYGYPFTCCTQCGPRFSILKKMPFDRSNTSMQGFKLCPQCQSEFDDVRDRRFYAQTISCPNCGPKLSLIESVDDEKNSDGQTALQRAKTILDQGGLLLVKGIGGFQFMCRSDSTTSVERLRRFKRRQRKAFAVMVANPALANQLVEFSPSAHEMLSARSAPIVLGKKKPSNAFLFMQALAPDSSDLGVMLPNSALHHLLLESLEVPVICTSANESGEPMIMNNQEALAQLPSVDAVLLHDRDIIHRLDDGIYRDMGKDTLCMRLGRGNSPLALPLPFTLSRISSANTLLGVGAELKSTVAFSLLSKLYVSSHLGDLDSISRMDNYEREINVYRDFLKADVHTSVSDLHPDFVSSKVARGFTNSMSVQHHRAHALACAAEHRFHPNQTIFAMCFDGFGLGDYGQSWGSECFVGTLNHLTHIAGLSPVANQGDTGSREPWRTCLSHLLASGLSHQKVMDLMSRFSSVQNKALPQVMSVLSKQSKSLSSMGRLLDAVSYYLGLVEDVIEYEGQGAMALEACAELSDHQDNYRFEWARCAGENAPLQLNLQSAWHQCLLDSGPLNANADIKAYVARKWFNTLISAYSQLVQTFLAQKQITTKTPVIFSGGCFQNRILSNGLKNAIESLGCQVYQHSDVPCNDGGISVGQVYAALCLLAKKDHQDHVHVKKEPSQCV